jgi:hypothetical protein
VTLRKQPRSVIPTGHRTGRPTVAADVEQLVVRMATENPTWSYTRLVGALGYLGHQVGRNSAYVSH